MLIRTLITSSRLKLSRPWAERFAVSPGTRQIMGEGAWVVFGQIVTAICLLAGMRALTEFIPPDVFGTVSLLVGLSTFTFNIICLPQLHAALRFYPELAKDGKATELRTTLGYHLRWTTVWLVALILVCGVIADRWNSGLFLMSVTLAFLLAFEVLRSFELNLLTAARRQRPFALWQSAESLAKPLLAVLAVVIFGATPQSVLGGYAVATAVVLVIALCILRRKERDRKPGPTRRNSRLMREIRSYALPLIPVAIFGWLTAFSDRYVLAGFYGAKAVGLYAAAYGLVSRAYSTCLDGALLGTLRPVYFEAVSSGDKTLEHKTVSRWILTTLVISIVGTIGMFLLSGFLTHLLLAESFQACASLMPILAVAFSFMGLSHVFNTISLAYKQSKFVMYSEAAAAVTMLIAGVPLIAAYGAIGAAAATCLAYSIQLLFAFLFSRRFLPAARLAV